MIVKDSLEGGEDKDDDFDDDDFDDDDDDDGHKRTDE